MSKKDIQEISDVLSDFADYCLDLDELTEAIKAVRKKPIGKKIVSFLDKLETRISETQDLLGSINRLIENSDPETLID